MSKSPDILCIGSVLWDVIGHSRSPMHLGADVPGRIRSVPGGVALNIAMMLARFDLTPALLSAVGTDGMGRDLIASCDEMGLITAYIHRSDLPTDRYMAIETPEGIVGAIADAHSLEAAGATILTALEDGRLGAPEAPYEGKIALDGNLTLDMLRDIAQSPLFEKADLRIAPASPGKALRLRPFVQASRGLLYVNLEEAGYLCDQSFENSQDAARALLDLGMKRAIITNGGADCTDADHNEIITVTPPDVPVVNRLTGAGDTFMAAHIAAETRNDTRAAALAYAAQAAAIFVSGVDPT